jgi:hypothetical protein
MRYEYKQVRYRSEDGRFDGSLNTMAADGWKVESIDRIDGIFLVTYSRALGEHLVVSTCSNIDELNETLYAHRNSRLVSMSKDGFWTLIWEVLPVAGSSKHPDPTPRKTSSPFDAVTNFGKPRG